MLLSLIAIVFSIALPKFKSIQKLVDRLNLVARENLTGHDGHPRLQHAAL